MDGDYSARVGLASMPLVCIGYAAARGAELQDKMTPECGLTTHSVDYSGYIVKEHHGKT